MRNQDGSWEVFDDYVLDFALDRSRAGEKVAIVTLAKIEGSSPRPLGAQMAVAETGRWVGYLSGGCIERAVVAEALSAIEEGRNRRVRYGRGSKYLDIQLPCGSAIELIFDVTRPTVEFAAIDARLQQRLPAIMHVPTEPGATDTDHVLACRYLPRKRLVVAGIGPAAVQLVKFGRLAGFDVILHSSDRPTMQEVLTLGVEVVPIVSPADVPRLHADSRTAIVFMFHDHLWERKLLPAALATNAFYIGAMGSRATHQMRLKKLRHAGIDDEQLDRIRGPAGLFAGAKSAADIALSILAEIMQIERDAAQTALPQSMEPVRRAVDA